MAQLGQQSQTCAYYASRKALDVAQLVALPYSVRQFAQCDWSLQSCQVTVAILQGALAQVTNYTMKYFDKLSARHLQLLGQLKTLCQVFDKAISKSTTKHILSPSAFLCQYHFDIINFFPLNTAVHEGIETLSKVAGI